MTVAIFLIVGLLIGILGTALLLHFRAQSKERLRQQENATVTTTILAYFQKSGVQSNAFAFRLDDGRLVALVEAEPQKRLRFSFIIEQSLRTHIKKTTGLSLALVFWRFPFAQKNAEQSYGQPFEDTKGAEAPSLAPEDDDDMKNFVHARMSDGYMIDETSWDNYESAVVTTEEKIDADSVPLVPDSVPGQKGS